MPLEDYEEERLSISMSRNCFNDSSILLEEGSSTRGEVRTGGGEGGFDSFVVGEIEGMGGYVSHRHCLDSSPEACVANGCGGGDGFGMRMSDPLVRVAVD